MLDLHNHILPGIDDGPTSMEESLEMARLAAEDGTKVIVATPHHRQVVERSSVAVIREMVDRFNHELQARSISLKVLLGMENHLDMDIVEQVDMGLALPIDGTRYILIELPFEFYPIYTEDVLFNLRIKGFRPIIAHPERNAPIQENPKILSNLVGQGILSQITAASIIGTFGKGTQRVAKELLRQRLVHIISSDGHTAEGIRAPLLSPAVAAASKVVGRHVAMRMVSDIPQAILRDERIDVDVVTTSSRKGWWRFRR